MFFSRAAACIAKQLRRICAQNLQGLNQLRTVYFQSTASARFRKPSFYPNQSAAGHCSEQFHQAAFSEKLWAGFRSCRHRAEWDGLDRFRPADSAKRKQLRAALGISDEIVVLFAAHNFRLKGLQCLLEAWRSLDPKKFRLLVVGRDKIPPGASEFSNVKFLGHHSDPIEIYQTADLLVHPTFYDTFGRVILEALACALPVITTRFAGASELMTDGREGFVIDDPRRTSELVEKINCFRDANLLQEYSVAARLLAERFPKSEYLEKTVAVIEAEGRRKNVDR